MQKLNTYLLIENEEREKEIGNICDKNIYQPTYIDNTLRDILSFIKKVALVRKLKLI